MLYGLINHQILRIDTEKKTVCLSVKKINILNLALKGFRILAIAM